MEKVSQQHQLEVTQLKDEYLIAEKKWKLDLEKLQKELMDTQKQLAEREESSKMRILSRESEHSQLLNETLEKVQLFKSQIEQLDEENMALKNQKEVFQQDITFLKGEVAEKKAQSEKSDKRC